MLQLMDYEMMGAELIQQARLNQLFSHWMFEMLAGFDFFNDWYDGEEYNTQPVGSYVVVSQSGDSVHYSSYRIYGDVKSLDSSELEQNSDTERGSELTYYTPLNPYREKAGD